MTEGESEKAQEPTFAKKKQQNEEKKDFPPILKYIKTQVPNNLGFLLFYHRGRFLII